MESLARECVECSICTRDCPFLKAYGNPGSLAKAVLAGALDEKIFFECSLCGLCTALCPKGLDPSAAFLGMREKCFEKKGRALRAHRGILAYEKKGLSRRYSLYQLPEDCSTVFFPGCTFPGTRAKRTRQIYTWLKAHIPGVGIVLDCCTKPSHDLGRKAFFDSNFSALEDFLTGRGVQTIITVCPNCHSVFLKHSKILKTRSIYDVMVRKGGVKGKKIFGRVTVHDPCATRFEAGIHASVRRLIRNTGLEIREMAHCREKTVCCGEGGFVFPVASGFASSWGGLRKKEAGGNKVITYCAGCSGFLGKSLETDHLLDLVFEPVKTMEGTLKKTVPPFTYLSRIRLKRTLRRSNKTAAFDPPRHRETVPFFSMYQFIVLILLAAGIAGARVAGIDNITTLENIQQFVQGFGPVAPLVFMGIVSLSPAFFLPGAPFIIAGGLIFGPFWGVLYGITGATAGACIAFLTARYLASDWVALKLTHPSLIKLKNQTETHGWKIVAFTRLVPLFPFNLLSYALGLTNIKFSTYLVTSFICMLPGCIGYILLSSSLPDLFQGHLSLEFFAGMGIIALLGAMPFLLKKFKPENL